LLAAQHLVTNHVYRVHGDSATGTSSFVMFRWPVSESMPPITSAHGGVYFDEAVRTDEGWKFKRRRIQILWGPANFLESGRTNGQ
jgi:hypothetical protein